MAGGEGNGSMGDKKPRSPWDVRGVLSVAAATSPEAQLHFLLSNGQHNTNVLAFQNK